MPSYSFQTFPRPHPRDVKGLRGQKRINILSIDGGGIRGLIPAIVMEHMEKIMGKRIGEVFDVAAGTSTGGILAMLTMLPECPGSKTLSSMTTASDLVKIYGERGGEIFPISSNETQEGTDILSFVSKAKSAVAGEVRGAVSSVQTLLSKPKYSEKGLENVITEYCCNQGNDLTLTDTVKPVFISSVEMSHPWGPIFFSSLDAETDSGPNGSNYRLRDIARATSAAPTFLPPAQFSNVTERRKDGNCSLACIDGGICCNNPALAILTYVKSICDDDAEIVLISLGTGRVHEAHSHKQLSSWGTAAWIEPLISTMMGGSSQLVHDQLERIAASDNKTKYHRFQMMIPEEYTSKTKNKEWAKAHVACEELDNIRPKNIEVMSDLVRNEFLPAIDNKLGKVLEELVNPT